jgi:hypothetical protein
MAEEGEAMMDPGGAAAAESEDYGYGDDEAVVADYGYGDDDDDDDANNEYGDDDEGDETSFGEDDEDDGSSNVVDEDHSDNVDDDEGDAAGDDDANDPMRGLARRENRSVSRFRYSLLLLLALAAVVLSTGTFLSCRRQQHDAFRTSFDVLSHQVTSSFGNSMQLRLQALQGMALDFDAYSKYSNTNNASWPYVTLPDLQQRAAVAQSVAQAASIFIVPIVAGDDDDAADATLKARNEWESYAVQHAPDWLSSPTTTTLKAGPASPPFTVATSSADTTPSSSAAAALASYRSRTLPSLQTSMIPEHMFDFHGDYNNTTNPPNGPFAPLWQTAPFSSGLRTWINFNLLAWERVSFGLRQVMQTRRAVLEKVLNYPSRNENEPPVAVDSLLKALLGHDDNNDSNADAASAANGDYFKEPASPLFYPIVQKSSSSKDKDDGDEDQVVAVVTAIVYWRFFLEHLLHPSSAASGSNRITVVIQNSCNTIITPSQQSFTYELNGKDEQDDGGVAFLGWGDLHDAKFDKLMAQTSTSTKSSSSSLTSSSSSNTLPLDDDYCSFTMTVYPTTIMMNQYITTTEPLLYTSLMLGVFILAMVVFLTYDDLVERRQKIVYNHAMRATAVVSSLFPEAVRDRLFAGEDPHGDAAVANAAAEVGTPTVAGASAGGGGAAAAAEQDPEAAAAATSSDASTDGSNDGTGGGSCDLEIPLLRASASASNLSNHNTQTLAEPTKMRLKNFLHGSAPAMAGGKSSGVNKPIADLVRMSSCLSISPNALFTSSCILTLSFYY